MNKTKYVYVNEQFISSSLICPICLDILEDPYTHISCDSAFCHSCLVQLTEPICPICRWNWDDILPIEYNRDLTKTNRLIRNMLDELYVKCNECEKIFHRGQFEHECQSIKKFLIIKKNKLENIPMILSILSIFLFILFIYSYRNIVFERAINRHNELINDIGINIDKYLFEKFYYLIIKIIEYSIEIFIFNLFLWFSILFYGDRFTSKSTSRILKKFIEISIIINIIIYSIYY